MTPAAGRPSLLATMDCGVLLLGDRTAVLGVGGPPATEVRGAATGPIRAGTGGRVLGLLLFAFVVVAAAGNDTVLPDKFEAKFGRAGTGGGILRRTGTGGGSLPGTVGAAGAVGD